MIARSSGDGSSNNWQITKIFVLISIFLLGPFSAQAKELFVDANSGNDNISYAQNDANNAWATIGRAVWGDSNRNNANSSQAGQAGDTITVRAGTYRTNQGTGSRANPIYNPVNNGTNGSPIIIRADGAVTLESSTNGAGEPIIGTFDRRYIVWDGFTINEANVDTTADTGPVVVWESDNIVIQNLIVRGKTVNWGDNHNSVRLEYATNVLIRNNQISENRGGANNFNGSAIMMYDTSDIIVEHNEIRDSQGGIFIKGSYGATANHNITIRYNMIRDVEVGITHGIINDAGRGFGARVYQNIIHGSSSAVTFIGYNGSSPANIDFVNNTVYDSNNGLFLKPSTAGYRDIVIKNNIIANSANFAIQGEDITDVSNMDFAYNIYTGFGSLARIAYVNHSLVSWQSSFNQDRVGSSQANAEFVNASNGNFRLGNSSPARNAGIDILNLRGQGTNANISLGAYVTGNEDIGLTGEQIVVTVRPEPPTLR